MMPLQAIGASPTGIPAAKTPDSNWRGATATPSALRLPPAAAAATTPGSETISARNELADAMQARQVRQAAAAAAAAATGNREDVA